MSGLLLVRIGSLPPRHLDDLCGYLAAELDCTCETAPFGIDDAPAFDSHRGQHDCRVLLPILEAIARQRGTRVLGVADVDLFSAVFTFVFGEARLGGVAGLLSLHRLRPTLYGLPGDPELVAARCRKVALHEVGHLHGLVHCPRPGCAMYFSGSAEELDLKGDRFCPVCDKARIRDARSPGVLD